MDNLQDRLAEIYGDGRWVIAIDAAAGAVRIHQRLADWGSRSLVVASNEGTGELPDTDIVYTRSTSDTVVGSIREFFKSVEEPTSQVQAQVDDFDPAREAQVIAEDYATAQRMVGRPTFGVRRTEWSAWEDKMRVDALWEDLDVAHAPYRIVDVSDAAPAAATLASDMGSVWVADNSRGWHGGADFVRWVRSPAEFTTTTSWFESRADRIRVMPFLDGLPCSIHGWVTDNGVATFLPVEILILRDEINNELVYAGVSTGWAPPASLVNEMRSVAKKVGEALGERVSYRGPFGIDGIATIDGFRPTELNPRMSAGAGVQLGKVDVPLGLLMRAEIEGLVGVDHNWLERAAIEQREPVVHFGKMVTKMVRESVDVAISDAGVLVLTESEDSKVGTITAGPSATGSYITGTFDPDRVGIGKPVAPLIASALNLVSARWDLGLPVVAPAPDLVS